MTNLEDRLKRIAERSKTHFSSMATEEAVKTAVVLPFLHALGYDVFDPLEVVPEFTADAVGKKGEKVDYAISLDGQIRILVECKPITTQLDAKHLAQLFRYFTVTSAKFAILTNGRYFQFYTDLDELNKLDLVPFLTIDLFDLQPGAVSELRKFEKNGFNIDNILATAERLKYTFAIKKNIQEQIDNPGETFVRLVSSNVYAGKLTAPVKEMLGSIVKAAFKEILRDSVQTSLTNALASTEIMNEPVEVESDEIVTTEEEIEAYMICKAIVREVIKPGRVNIRDAKTYCAILIDNNNRKPLARLHFNRNTKYLGLFDGEVEEKVAVKSLDDIFIHAARLKSTALKYADAPATES